MSKALIDSNVSHDNNFLFDKYCAKRVWINERRNKKFKDWNTSSNNLVYLSNNVIVLLEV